MSEHSHSYHEVGAASDTHEHYVGEIDGAARQESLADLRSKVEELTRQVADLQAHFSAEREISGAVRGGALTIPAIAAALRAQGDKLMEPFSGVMLRVNQDLPRTIGAALHGLAAEIEAGR